MPKIHNHDIETISSLLQEASAELSSIASFMEDIIDESGYCDSEFHAEDCDCEAHVTIQNALYISRKLKLTGIVSDEKSKTDPQSIGINDRPWLTESDSRIF